jgi:hypothetical protein
MPQRTDPGSADTPSGKRMLLSIHSDNCKRGGISDRRAQTGERSFG